MVARPAPRSISSPLRQWLTGSLVTTLAVTLLGALPSAPAHAANPVTPGNYRGLGFDQCEAPSQKAMSTWIRKSPFRAAGIYISGDSRACQRQTNLTATWVRTQLAEGWHLMPITLGPQASCTTRERYLRQVRINPSPTDTYSKARTQGVLEARKAVAAARNLGIVPGSTIFYDLEAFSITKSTSCTSSALWFLSSWTTELHRLRYASGYYSSAASGIKMIDDARVRPGNRIVMPDQIWIADWNGRADTKSSYIRSDGWQPHGRAHQYQGGHNETWGGVTINIDRNYLDLRTPRIPGAQPQAATPKPAASSPRYTGNSMSDPKCSPTSISRRKYRTTSPRTPRRLVVPLQCLLKQQRLYPYEVTGRWNTQTLTGSQAFQRRVGHSVRNHVNRSDWVAFLSAGNDGTTLRARSSGADVVRVQRALNAAGKPRLKVTGSYNRATRRAVGVYQRRVGVQATRVVGPETWSALRAGRR